MRSVRIQRRGGFWPFGKVGGLALLRCLPWSGCYIWTPAAERGESITDRRPTHAIMSTADKLPTNDFEVNQKISDAP